MIRKLINIWIAFHSLTLSAQVKLHLDSMLRTAYERQYGFREGLMCIPFVCDPLHETRYKKNDTAGLCGRYVFVDPSYTVKIRPGFDLPCSFEPVFSEGLCAVNIANKLVYIDTAGRQAVQTGLTACSQQRNIASPFRGGRARILKGSNTLRHYYEVYYIDRSGTRLPQQVSLKVLPKKTASTLVAAVQPEPKDTASETAVVPVIPGYVPYRASGYYPADETEASVLLSNINRNENRILLQYKCGDYQLERMNPADTIYCGKFVFTDTFFNVRIAQGFSLPCGFEPEFSEGLCAVAINSMIVYIDTLGTPVINTGLKACGPVMNKASTFKNGIATLYTGDPYVRGLFTTIAINNRGERVRLLEFDDLELAVQKLEMFSNLNAEEAKNCFVGRGKTNGLWFLIEKSGKIRKKLEPVKK